VTELLKIEAVSVHFWRRRQPVDVLRDVSLELAAGEFGGVWGVRGAGKTTLARVAAGALAPDTGRVVFQGQDLAAADPYGARHARIGLATRRSPRFDGIAVEKWITATMLTSCGSLGEARKRARSALERVGAAEIAGEPWDDLSEGEQMLVAIAQAIVRSPKLLVVDDPIGGLGGVQRGEIMDLLRGVAAGGVTVLMTAAEVTDLQGADRIWALDGARLDGPSARTMGDVVPLRPAGGA
jgi:ABC-type multidrug transport system ATPase subunit